MDPEKPRRARAAAGGGATPRLAWGRWATATAACALALGATVPALGQVRTAAVVVSAGGAGDAAAASWRSQLTAALGSDGFNVLDAGAVDAAMHFTLPAGAPLDDAACEALRRALDADQLVHLRVEVPADQSMMAALVLYRLEQPRIARFGEIDAASAEPVARLYAQLRADLGTVANPEPIAPPPEAEVEPREVSAETASSGIADNAESAEPTLDPPVGWPLRFSVGLETSHAVYPGQARDTWGGQTLYPERTIVRLRVEFQPLEWLSVALLGAWARSAVSCTPATADAMGTIHSCPSFRVAELAGLGTALRFAFSLSVGPLVVTPSVTIAGLVFPTVHGETPSFATQADVGARVTWRFHPNFAVWASAAFLVDVAFIDPIELGYHPNFETWYFYAPLIGGTGSIGVEVTP